VDIQEIWNWFVRNFIQDPWGAISIIGGVLVFVFRRAIRGGDRVRWGKVTHLRALAIYYRELPAETPFDTGEVYYQYQPRQFATEDTLSQMGYGIRFFIIKLDIINKDTIENRIINLKAKLTCSKAITTQIVSLKRAYVTEDDLTLFYLDQQEFEHTIEDFSVPLILKPGVSYTKHVCLEIADNVQSIDKGKIEIEIKDRFNRKTKVKVRFVLKDGVAFIEQ